MVLFKIFENILSKKLSSYFETTLSKFQCGFRKEFSTQYCLFCLPKKWRETFVKDKAFGALLTVLLKALDCLSHVLSIVKLYSHGIFLLSSKLLANYLTNKEQKWNRQIFFVKPLDIVFPRVYKCNKMNINPNKCCL